MLVAEDFFLIILVKITQRGTADKCQASRFNLKSFGISHENK
jgi:hypothetical protein